MVRGRRSSRGRRRGRRRPDGRPAVALRHVPLQSALLVLPHREQPARARPAGALAAERWWPRCGRRRRSGFARAGVTGGEVFMLPGIAEVLAQMAGVMPTTALTNGTLLTERLLRRLGARCRGTPASRSRSRSTPPTRCRTTRLRGPRNFARVCASVPQAARARHPRADRDHGRGSVAATSCARVCDLHRSWGIPDEDHIVRPVVRRGRAATRGMGVVPQPATSCPSSRSPRRGRSSTRSRPPCAAA